MHKTPARWGTLTLATLSAVALLALIVTVTAAAQPLASPPPSHTPALSSASASTPIPLPDPAWRIPIAADGLYRLSYETLAGAGVPVAGTPPSGFHLLWRGQEVALQEVGTGDGTFDPGDAFLFYAEKFHGSVQDEKYTDENVYWLAVYTTTPGLRMGSRSVAPGGAGQPLAWYTATAHFEENYWHWSRWSTSPGTDATWFWVEMQAVKSTPAVTYTYAITLTAPAAEVYTAALSVELAGRSDNAHHLHLSLNGTDIGEISWTGKRGWTATLPVSATLIQEGANTLDVAVLTGGNTQWIYLNWIEVDYRRRPVAQDDVVVLTPPVSGAVAMTLTGFSTAAIQLYDITYPLTPTHLEGGTAYFSGTAYALAMSDTLPAETAYLAVVESAVLEVSSIAVYHPPDDLISSGSGADEIIVAPAEFITAVQPLADLRRSQGLRVQVVDVEDVYALFNGGVFHPEAIRAFVAHAYANWPGPPPAYLLLVGDGNLNLKGYYNPAVYGDFVPTLIPPYLEFADPDQGEVAVDSRYGDVDWDGMPEVTVGRIPADSVAQVEGVVAKILAYESASVAPWITRTLMVADDYDPGAGDFKAVAEGLRQDFVPAQMDVSTVYLDDYSSALSATQDLTQTWSQGTALLTFVGHGAVHRWTHEPLLLNTQLPGLTGTTGLPFVISLDCYDGYWMFPPRYPVSGASDVRSIGEWATTVLTDRGAIAVFGPAGLGFVGVEDLMARAMYQAMFEDGIYRLGPLTQVGREAIPTSYLARTYTLLGDPALQLPWWERITLAPTTLTVTVGTSTTLSTVIVATGTTRFGQEFPITPAWTVGAGTVDGWGHFTAPHYSTVTHLTAHLGPVSATVTLNVVAEEPAAVTVSPDPLVIGVGEKAQMTATVIDQWGHSMAMTPVWSTDIGEIDAQGVFTAPPYPVQGWITATVGSVAGRAHVEVQSRIYLPLVLRAH